MSGLTFGVVLAWMLSAFFLFGAGINAVGARSIRDDYRRWGYPNGFRFVTALLELVAAILLLTPATRLAGAMLGAAIMAAAVATTLAHREPGRAIAPATVLGWACAVVGLTFINS